MVRLQRTAQTCLVTVEQGTWHVDALRRSFAMESDARVYARRVAVDLRAGHTPTQIAARLNLDLAA